MQGRDIAIVIGAVVLVILLLGLLGGGWMMGPGMMGWGGFGFSPIGWVMMLLFWGLILGGGALLLIWLFRQGQPAGVGPGPATRSPVDILRERYARGEITREQFEQMRRDIEER